MGEKNGKTQLEETISEIIKIGKELNLCANHLWKPLLKEKIYLEECLDKKVSFDPADWDTDYEGRAICGYCDLPQLQKQEPYAVELIKNGHVAIYGMSGTGKTLFLQTFVLAMALKYSPNMLQIYGIDFGGRTLGNLEEMPHCGGVVFADDKDKIEQIIEKIKGQMELNGVSIQMYECESGDIVEKDEYLCMYPVLGYGDLEADNIFLKKINNKIYICGSSDSLTCIYANGSTFTSFIVLYENGEFLKVAGEEKPVQGSGFGLYPNALVIADEMEKIGMTKSAEKVRKTHIPVFDQEDAVDKMLLKITGKNDGLDMKEWNKSRDVSALGKLILKLQVSGFEKNEKIAIVDSQELLKPMENEVSNMSEPEDNKIALTKDDVMRIVSAHYNEQLTDGGYYIIYNAEGIETETGFNFPLHYQLSEEEAQKIVDEGGTPSANRLVGYLDINTESGMVTPDFDEPWNLYD